MENEYVYKIVDRDNIELPLKNGRYRTEEEANKILENLNRHGEYAPYTKIDIRYETTD